MLEHMTAHQLQLQGVSCAQEQASRSAAIVRQRTQATTLFHASCRRASHPGSRLLEPHPTVRLQVRQLKLLAWLAPGGCALPASFESCRNQIAGISAGLWMQGMCNILLSCFSRSIARYWASPELSTELTQSIAEAETVGLLAVL